MALCDYTAGKAKKDLGTFASTQIYHSNHAHGLGNSYKLPLKLLQIIFSTKVY
jgi:hypothetical protein